MYVCVCVSLCITYIFHVLVFKLHILRWCLNMLTRILANKLPIYLLKFWSPPAH